MTVIFHTNAGLPVLAGDMLLSMPGPKAATALRLPSQPNGIMVPSGVIPEYIPVRMRRKIFIVNDHLAVGAAGSVMHIQMFISDIINKFHGWRSFESAELHEFLNGYASSPRGQEIFHQIGFILLAEATDWRGYLTRGQTTGTNVVSNRFGKSIAIGSGSHSIIEQIGELDKYQYGMSQPKDSQVKFPEFQPLFQNLCLLANVYWNEFVNPSSVFQAWGGAYDLIYQDSNNVFQYLTDYTLVLRLFDADQADKGIQLMNVLKYERKSDVSYVAMLTDNGLDFFGAKDITSSAVPAILEFKADEFTMNSKYHISIILVGKGNKFARPLIQVDGLDPGAEAKQTVFTWINEDRRLCVAFHAEHDKWLEEQVMDYYSRHASVLSS